MSDNRLQEPIYFQEELINEYAKNRKALEERDVKDLLRCLVNFMIKNKNDNYAFKIPKIGMIYNNTDVFNQKDKLYTKKMGEYFCGNINFHNKTLFEKHQKTREELQQFQNEKFEEN